MDILELNLSEFPEQLSHIPEPPTSLWMQGSLPPPGTKLLAVVGSRALSSYGRQVCESLIMGLRGYPISIVSGLAFGADAIAHQTALRAGLHTISVPGSGLGYDSIYPRAHISLAREILESGGALVSEHEPSHKARIYDFPSRNRIMVGLCDAVLMVEAGKRSGTLITARLAADYNRNLLCIPHRIGDAHGFGAQLFLRLGAALVAEPAHILEALNLEPQFEKAQIDLATLNPNERILYELLDEPKSRDELIRTSNLAANVVISALGTLELQKILKEEFGQWRRMLCKL